MTETAEPSAERPAFPIPRATECPYRPSTEHVDLAGGPMTKVRLGSSGKGRRVVRGVVAVTAGALTVMSLIVTAALPASASPAVQPVTEFGKVPTMGLNMVDGAALHCPEGVTTWSTMIVPIEMAIPQGKPNGTIDPLDVRNMANDSALWNRSLGSTQAGGSMILDKEWTQDGRHTMPIIRTGLRSGTYLLGALCATPGKERYTYPLDSRGNLIGEWYFLTFTWVDIQPAQGTFHFERQLTAEELQQGKGLVAGEPGSDSTPTPRPAATAAQPSGDTSGGMGWPGWLAIAAALGLALLIGIRLSRRRREPT